MEKNNIKNDDIIIKQNNNYLNYDKNELNKLNEDELKKQIKIKNISREN